MGNIYIVTDSTADIPKDLALENNITVIPLTISYEGKMYKDGVDLGTEELLQMLEGEELPKTSQVNPMEFFEAYKSILEKDSDATIISIHISSKLSGICQSAIIAKDMLTANNIHILDTGMVSFGIGLIVVEATKMVKKGLDVDEVLSKLKILVSKVRIAFFVNTLDYLKKGGRISSVKATVGNLLNLKPVIYMQDGILDVLDKPRGSKKAKSRLIQYVEEEGIDNSLSFCVGNVGCKEDADEFKDELMNMFNIEKSYTTDAGPAVATYAGRGTIGVYFFSDK